MAANAWRRRDLLMGTAAVGFGLLGSAAMTERADASSNGDPFYNVKDDFGAKGDGTTDDTAAFSSALSAAGAAGGGIVYAPPGVYLIAATTQGVAGGIAGNVGLAIPSNVTLCGAGKGATVVRLQAGASVGAGSAAQVISNAANATRIRICDLTIDGNGANQTAPTNGMVFWAASQVAVERVSVQNVFTTAAAEQSCIQFISSSLCAATEVDCNQEGRFFGNGIAYSSCIQCVTRDCTVQGIAKPPNASTSWRCFVCDNSQNMLWSGCHAFLNTTSAAGFDCSSSTYVTYDGCVSGSSGGPQEDTFPAPYPYNMFNQNLGNAGDGFNLVRCTNVDLIGCTAGDNHGHNLQLQASAAVRVIGGTYFGSQTQGILINGAGNSQCSFLGMTATGNTQGALYNVGGLDTTVVDCNLSTNAGHGLEVNGGTVHVVGGLFVNNAGTSNNGVEFWTASDAKNTRVTGHPEFRGNSGNDWAVGGTGYSATGQVSASLVPANVGGSGTAFANPTPFDCMAYLTTQADAGITAVAINGAVVYGPGASPAKGALLSFLVPAGGTIAITWAAAVPTQVWTYA